jgi:hypothetical protein
MRFSRLAVSLALSLCALAALPAPGAAVTATSEYIVGSTALPTTGNGDVAIAGTALFVGQGAFGAGTESIARLERDGTAVTVVTGLNAIGGLAYDRAGNRLLFSDNGGEIVGATTGDTVYALGAPLAAGVPVPAGGLALVPAGTIPFAQAVLPLAGGALLVGDAVGFGNGRVIRVSGGTPTNLITGLDYTAGVSLALDGDELLVGEVDSTTFQGAIVRYDLAGAPLGAFASGLSGAYDSAFDPAGNLIVSGGFTGDFSSSTVVRIDPLGGVDEIASGFFFSTGLDVDAESGQILVLDIGAASLDTLTPVDGLTPGGKGRRECQIEMWGGAPERSGSGFPRTRWTCTDGAPCDRDGVVNSACGFLVGACFTVPDPRAPQCVPAAVESATVTSRDPLPVLPLLQAALDEVLPSTGAVCSRAVPIAVSANARTVRIAVDGAALGRRVDKDPLKLRCLPAGA